jgi:hypothetical protein
MGIRDTLTGEQWVDKQGLGWTNPYNQSVWVYNIALARELAELGFDEIQFDYIRFPSDGDLSHIRYPLKPGQLSKTQCIGKFLESASGSLHPLGSPSRTISVDLYRLAEQLPVHPKHTPGASQKLPDGW